MSQTQIPVGASLLAKASAHPASMLPDPPPSRAGSLPQFLHPSNIRFHPQIPRTKKGTFVPLRYAASNLSKYPSTAT
ncbi:hypothetical protein FGA82_13460 [Pseudomonas fluorescens]|nr:hypothetical protein FGA82_13460 [Pseudomonas fluorescens]